VARAGQSFASDSSEGLAGASARASHATAYGEAAQGACGTRYSSRSKPQGLLYPPAHAMRVVSATDAGERFFFLKKKGNTDVILKTSESRWKAALCERVSYVYQETAQPRGPGASGWPAHQRKAADGAVAVALCVFGRVTSQRLGYSDVSTA